MHKFVKFQNPSGLQVVWNSQLSFCPVAGPQFSFSRSVSSFPSHLL